MNNLKSFLVSWVPDSIFIKQKSHARKIAWLKSPVRHRTLAPFDGITRIRFKGSSNWTSQPSRLPRISISVRIRLGCAKSKHMLELTGLTT
jgi:hypothetical protein